jgi:hypothetical protein
MDTNLFEVYCKYILFIKLKKNFIEENIISNYNINSLLSTLYNFDTNFSTFDPDKECVNSIKNIEMENHKNFKFLQSSTEKLQRIIEILNNNINKFYAKLDIGYSQFIEENSPDLNEIVFEIQEYFQKLLDSNFLINSNQGSFKFI